MKKATAINKLYDLLNHPLNVDTLLVRGYELSDVKDVSKILGSSQVMDMIGTSSYTLEQVEGHFEKVKQNIKSGYKIGLVIEDTKEKKVVGTIGVKLKNIASDVIEYEYLLHPMYWGKGIMTEVVGALNRYICSIDYSFSIEANCRVDNKASERVLVKNNMVYVYSDYIDGLEYRRFRYDKEKV